MPGFFETVFQPVGTSAQTTQSSFAGTASTGISAYRSFAAPSISGSPDFNEALNEVALGASGFPMFENLTTSSALPGQSVTVSPVVNNIKSAARDFGPLILIAIAIIGLIFVKRKK